VTTYNCIVSGAEILKIGMFHGGHVVEINVGVIKNRPNHVGVLYRVGPVLSSNEVDLLYVTVLYLSRPTYLCF